MRHLRPVVFAVLACAVCAVPAAVAQAAPPGGAALTPVHRAGGLPGSELFGTGWADTMDVDTFGTCISLGGKGKVIAPIASFDLEVSCSIRPGTPLYIFFGTECSDVEEPPFFGDDAEAQRECALAFNDAFFVSATLSVDGGDPVNTMAPRFAVVSPQMTVDLPADNILGVPPQTATFVAAGWALMVRGLRPGEHTIEAAVTDSEGFTTVAVLTIDVVPVGRAG